MNIEQQLPNVSPTKAIDKKSRFVELEAFRGIAALLIVIYHAYQQSRIVAVYVYEHTPFHFFLRNLDMGVACFFVLSGFLIFLPFVRASASQSGAVSAKGFLIRRVIRIVPLYYIAILVVWGSRYTGLQDQRIGLLENLTFTQVFDSVHIFWTIGPAWSLADEVWFYILLAIIGTFVYRWCGKLQSLNRRFALLSGISIVLGVISLIFKWFAFYVAHIPLALYAVYYGPVAMLDTFAIGMLFAVIVGVYESHVTIKKITSRALLLCALLLFVVIFFLRSRSSFIDVFFYTFSGIAFLLILAATVAKSHDLRWKRLLRSPLLQYLGLVSYSLYLWHEPILIAVTTYHILTFTSPVTFLFNTIVLLLLSIAVAVVSYWAIEYPTLFLRHLFSAEGILVTREKKLRFFSSSSLKNI